MYTVEIFFTHFAIWVKISPLGGGAHKILVRKRVLAAARGLVLIFAKVATTYLKMQPKIARWKKCNHLEIVSNDKGLDKTEKVPLWCLFCFQKLYIIQIVNGVHKNGHNCHKVKD